MQYTFFSNKAAAFPTNLKCKSLLTSAMLQFSFSRSLSNYMRGEEKDTREEKMCKEIYKNIDIDLRRKIVFPENPATCRLARKRKERPKSLALEKISNIQGQLEKRSLDKVEYDMDSFDRDFLGSVKDMEISSSDFELIVDRLEKEWFGFLKSLIEEESDVHNEIQLYCDICTKSETASENDLLLCKGCNLCVHQECYGVPYVQSNMWACRKCIYVGKETPKCELCTRLGGAYKQTEDFKWAHVLCVLYVENAAFLNPVFLEPVDLSGVKGDYCKKQCLLCQSKDGVVIDCSFSDCNHPYHVTCGIEEGYYYDHNNLISYCGVHDPTLKTAFWSIEDFYGFGTLSYKSLLKRLEIRARGKLHRPVCSSGILSMREAEVFCDQEAYSRILELDLFDSGLQKKEEVLNLVGKYWAGKRALTGKALLRDFDVLSSDVDISPWIRKRKESQGLSNKKNKEQI